MLSHQLGLADLRNFLATHSIEEVYQFFAYDYAMESEYGANGKHASERESFVGRLQWVCEPRDDLVRRIFNQVNAFYAEEWVLSNVNVDPREFLSTCNHLLLYRQGKRTGLRLKPIEFGIRRDIDFMDPRRHFQLLRGIAPEFLQTALEIWTEAVRNSQQDADAVLALVMALVAIHPFTDGNGRTARLAFTWIRMRFELESLWLAEADDGEFLRVGEGIDSTEYLMGRFAMELCGGYNVVHYTQGSSSAETEHLALKTLETNLSQLCTAAEIVFETERFRQLRSHLHEHGHITVASPRFAALEGVLA
jgi:hypothetical protein